ncbi:MAG TPA: T9SS type A sorting domain-containing protein [Cyclobacteriaceae bacterium]|nr:T9SS type A sorting domain-containing protein [Cyclobacteriaceae bacterium]
MALVKNVFFKVSTFWINVLCKVTFLFALFAGTHPEQLLAQSTTRTISAGNYNNTATWNNNQIPAAGSGTLTNPVAFGHNVTVTGNVSITNGVYFLGVNSFAGTISASTSSSIVTGSGTSFLDNFSPGDVITVSAGVIGTVVAVSSQTQLTLSGNSHRSASNLVYFKLSNTNVNDPSGVPYHELSIQRATGNFNASNGILDVKSGTTNNFEGGAEIDKNSLIVRSGARLILGPLFCAACDPQTWDTEGLSAAQKDERRDKCLNIGGADVSNEYVDCRQRRLYVTGNSQVIIEEGAEILVYGNVENKSNPGFVSLNGTLRIIGNYAATVGNASIVQDTPGQGDIITTGSMTTQGNSTIFGSKVNCSADCVGSALACSERIPGGFSISPSGILAFCDPITLAVSPNPVTPTSGSVSYQWEYSNDLDFPFNGSNRVIISGATNPTYLVDTLNVTGLYRIRVDVSGGGGCTAFSVPVLIDPGASGWRGGPGGSWIVPANWCGGVPTSNDDVVIPTGASPLIPEGSSVNVRSLSLQGTNSSTLGAQVTVESGATLNIFGNLVVGPDTNTPDNENTNSAILINQGIVNFVGGVDIDDPASIENVGKFLNGPGSTVNFNGFTQILDIGLIFPNEFRFNNLNVSSAKTLILSDTDYEITGNVSSSGNLEAAGSRLIFTGDQAQTIDFNDNGVFSITVNKSAEDVTLTSPLNLFGRLEINSSTNVISNGNLKLKSDDAPLNVDNSTQFDASIAAINNGGAVLGDVVVERFIIALPTDGNHLPYRYISSPVIDAEWTGGGLLKFNAITQAQPPDNTYTVSSGGWRSHNIEEGLVNGEGYRLRAADETKLSFTGEIVSGEITWVFNNTNAAWFMIGNPYPSAIAWLNDNDSTRWSASNVSSLMGIYDNFSEGYPNYFRYAFMQTPEDGVPVDQWGFEVEQNVIATAQAFWVYVGAGGGFLTIKENAKVGELEDGRFYRKDNSNKPAKLIIGLRNNELRDIAVIETSNSKANLRNRRFENISKLWNEQMNIYLLSHDQQAMLNLAYEESNSDLEIPIGVHVTKPGEYVMEFSFTDDLMFGKDIFLVDRYEGKSITVNSDAQYKFKVFDASKAINNRFYLSSKQSFEWAESIDIYTFPNPVTDILHIRAQGSNENVRSALFDSNGKQLDDASWKSSYDLDFRSLPKGIYIIKLYSSKGLITRKILKH